MAVDASEYYPFQNGIATEAEWSVYIRAVLTSGVLLGELNLLEPYGDGGGMQVKFKTGQTFLRGFAGRWTGADAVVPVTANASGQTRIDLLVTRVNLTLQKVQADVKPGTPGVNPSPPALQQDDTIWEEPLAQITVPTGATSITAPMVVDARTFARSPGIELGRPQATFAAAPANIAEVFLQGQTLSRVTYAYLATIPGIVAGPGDGVTTFKVIDLRRQVLGGRAAGDPDFGGAIGSSAGAARNAMAVSQMPTHNHGSTSAQSANHTHGYGDIGGDATPVNVMDFAASPAGGWANYVTRQVNAFGATASRVSQTGGISADHVHTIPNAGEGAPFPVVQPTTLVNFVVRAR